MLQDELCQFLADMHGSRWMVQLSLQLCGDFNLVLQAMRALMGESKGTREQDAAAYQWTCYSLIAFGINHGLLCSPVRMDSNPSHEDTQSPTMSPNTFTSLNARDCMVSLRRC